MKIARVALDVPLHELFDFRLPEGLDPPVGALVIVPFGRSERVGAVIARATSTPVPESRLRPVSGVVADVAPLGAEELALYRFCAAYYLKPLGEVIAAALPPRLRQVRRRPVEPEPVPRRETKLAAAHTLTPAQRDAIEQVRTAMDRFHPVLLQGVTGSGKTEVYLHLISEAIARGRQALFLVPEIGLTPQLEAQVRDRFAGAHVTLAHSHLAPGARARAWIDCQRGAAQIVLGTRLAILQPFHDLGLVIVDEEQDASYKQQEGTRYGARDLAVWRAHHLGIPIVLGSATPSLESFQNALEGRYSRANLPARAGEGVRLPQVRIVDTRADRAHEGLSFALRQALRECLARAEQALVFVNRRGFSPVLHCRACAWHSRCSRCSANLVVHRGAGELRCHHCGHREVLVEHCPVCASSDLAPIGQGTQRVEEALREAFPQARIARVDRDSTARRGSFRRIAEQTRAGEIDILVGTQMLAKGHDYPLLTLVGVLDSDQALYSADFRAAERLFAQLVQVAGRAGRAERPGEVLIQTDFPGHALYAAAARQDYERFALEALEERRTAGFPPFSHLAILRAESKRSGECARFLARAARLGHRLAGKSIEVFDPVPAPLERKAGFERWQLLVRARARGSLQSFLKAWCEAFDSPGPRRVRWVVDVDPQEA